MARKRFFGFKKFPDLGRFTEILSKLSHWLFGGSSKTKAEREAKATGGAKERLESSKYPEKVIETVEALPLSMPEETSLLSSEGYRVEKIPAEKTTPPSKAVPDLNSEKTTPPSEAALDLKTLSAISLPDSVEISGPVESPGPEENLNLTETPGPAETPDISGVSELLKISTLLEKKEPEKTEHPVEKTADPEVPDSPDSIEKSVTETIDLAEIADSIEALKLSEVTCTEEIMGSVEIPEHREAQISEDKVDSADEVDLVDLVESIEKVDSVDEIDLADNEEQIGKVDSVGEVDLVDEVESIGKVDSIDKGYSQGPSALEEILNLANTRESIKLKKSGEEPNSETSLWKLPDLGKEIYPVETSPAIKTSESVETSEPIETLELIDFTKSELSEGSTQVPDLRAAANLIAQIESPGGEEKGEREEMDRLITGSPIESNFESSVPEVPAPELPSSETPDGISTVILLKSISDLTEEAEKASVIEETLTVEENPVIEEAPAIKEKPVIEEAPTIEENPIIEEAPTIEENPIIEEAPTIEENPIIEEAPVIEENPVIEEAPIIEETSVIEENVIGEVPVIEENPVIEEAPTIEENPIIEEAPTIEENPIIEEAPTIEENPIIEEAPAIEENPVVEEAPVIEENPVIEEAPAIEENPVIEENVIGEDTPGIGNASPAVEPVKPGIAARRIIEALRLGGVPPSYVEEFSVGREPEFLEVSRWLGSGKGSLAVIGEYGSGKTHFLELVSETALRKNWGVARIEIDAQEAPFHKPRKLYESFVNNFRYRENGAVLDFRAFLGRLNDPENPEAEKLQAHPYLGKLRQAWLDGGDKEWLLEWIEGRREGPAGFPALYEHQTAANIYGNLLSGLGWAAKHVLGLEGILVFFDEAETVDPYWYSAYQFDKALNTLRGLVLVSNNDEALIDDTPDAENVGAKSGLAYSRMTKQPVPYLWEKESGLKLIFSFVPEMLESMEQYSRIADLFAAMDRIELENLDETTLQALLGNIKRIYRDAYGFSVEYDLFPYLPVDRPRQFIKAAVEGLDLMRYNPGSDSEKVLR